MTRAVDPGHKTVKKTKSIAEELSGSILEFGLQSRRGLNLSATCNVPKKVSIG